MFSDTISLHDLIGSHVTGPFVLNKLLELAAGKGALISEYMAINYPLLPPHVDALIDVTPPWPFSNGFHGSQEFIHSHCSETMNLLSSEWLPCLIIPVVTCSLCHGSEFYGTTQWDPGIVNLACRATLQTSDKLYKLCACAAPAKNGLCHNWDCIVAVILATILRASAYIQMFEIMDTWPSPELPQGTHHDWDLILRGSTRHNWIFEGSFLGYAGDCDYQGYAAMVMGCWSAFVALPVHTPWDPGGSAIPCYLINGLRASRILRRRECHTPVYFCWALLQTGLWPVGSARIHEVGLVVLIY
jgi:hypothetical protein